MSKEAPINHRVAYELRFLNCSWCTEVDRVLRRISARRIFQRIRRETELSMRSLSNLLSQWALEKVETNSTFSRRKVSHVALNQSGCRKQCTCLLLSVIVLQDRSGERGAKIRFNVEIKKGIRRVNCYGEKLRCSEIFASCSRQIRWRIRLVEIRLNAMAVHNSLCYQ